MHGVAAILDFVVERERAKNGRAGGGEGREIQSMSLTVRLACL